MDDEVGRHPSGRATHEPSPDGLGHSVGIPDAVKFLEDSARYFERRPTNGEDRAHWANVYNAQNCRNIAALITTMAGDMQWK